MRELLMGRVIVVVVYLDREIDKSQRANEHLVDWVGKVHKALVPEPVKRSPKVLPNLANLL